MKQFLLLVLTALCLTANAKTGKEIIAENGFKSKVEPMLTTKWSQNGGENSMLPYLYGEDSERAVTGCGATALAQIMKYWEHPTQGMGDNYYVWNSPMGETVVLYADFEHTHYDWDNMISLYKGNSSATQRQIDAVSTLMLHIGIALEMKFNTSTATQIEYIHTVLKKYFGYNPNSQLVRYINGAYTMDEWLTMIYRELSEGRPILMGGRYEGTEGEANHIFVADGYDEDGKVHLNLGKADIGFNKNTYYDLTRDDQTYTKEMRMIIGISPNTLPAELTNVHISTPGTLLEKLGGELDSRKICRLKVTGTLDNEDLTWLKELTQITTGQLSYIDLSDCDIQGNTIAASAFDGCYTLQEIILPNTLTTIGSKAFRNCYGLYKVGLPQRLTSIESYAFTGCRYLGDAILPSSLSRIGTNPYRYDKLDRFEMNTNNENYTIVNHALLTKDGKKLLSMPFKCYDEYVVTDGVETIAPQAFLKSCMMTSIVLPASLKQIQSNAFLECFSLKDVYSHASSAPSIEYDSFDQAISNCTLHVPVGCISEYEQKGWTMFARIVDDIQTSYNDLIVENGLRSEVRPLIKTSWSKDDEVLALLFPDYNEGPNQQKFIPSSGAISMAQIMNYWKYPTNGKDSLYFTQPLSQGGYASFYANFLSGNYDWSNMAVDCSASNNLNTKQKNAVSKLVYHCAVSTFNKEIPVYKDGATQLEYCSSALKKYFGYNSNMHILNSAFYEPKEFAVIMYKEISEGRPIMIESLCDGNDEISMIDGYNSDGLLHIRRDKSDLYISPEDISSYIPNLCILIGITPNEKSDEVLRISVSSGNLAELIGDQSNTVTKLKLTGTLNAEDLSLLKSMAQYGMGQLYYLDLSDAEIEGNTLDGYSFQYCDLLQYVKLPSSLEKVGRHEFSYCYNLLNIDLQKVKTIDNYAFFYCRYLDDIRIPSSITVIGDNPFGSNKINRFTIENNSYFKFNNNTLFSKNGENVFSCLGNVKGELSIPEYVKRVNNMAYRGCDGITSIHIPVNVTSIGTYSFYECYNVSDVYCYSLTAPNLTANIDNYAFYPECFSCTLHVPVGCIDEYRQKNWDIFATIVDDIITEGISKVIEDAGSNNTVPYSITGQQVKDTRPNQIYIEKDWQGKSRKIIVK